MKGTNRQLVVTTALDEATEERKPLFAFPVQMCQAIDSSEPRFDRAAPSGAEYEILYRDCATQELVESSDLVRGVRTGDSFAVIADETIKAIDESLKSDQIVVERAVPLADVPFDLTTSRHFLQVPSKGGAARPYRLTYEALVEQPKKGKQKARPAMAMRVRFTSTTRQKMGVVWADPERGCLMLTTLAFAAQVRQPDEQVLSHQHAEVDPEMVAKVRQVVEALDRPDVGGFEVPVDEALPQRESLIEKALMGETIVAPQAEPVTVAADDVVDALEQSLAAVAA